MMKGRGSWQGEGHTRQSWVWEKVLSIACTLIYSDTDIFIASEWYQRCSNKVLSGSYEGW